MKAGGGAKPCAGCSKVAAALAGKDPWLIAVLPHGVLTLGEHQAMPGYAVLWSRVHVKELHHLERPALVAAALAGKDPWLIAVLPHGVLTLGEHQAMPGYAVLWSRVHVKELHHLERPAFAGFMGDFRRASRAVERATGCLKLNVASLGNLVPHAHLHLFPRRAEDPGRLRHPWIHEARFKDAGSDALRRRWVRALREAL